MIIPAVLSASGDFASYKKISTLSAGGDSKNAVSGASAFLKKYPLSKYIPDVRIILAENEPDPRKAISKFRTVITMYRYYPRRDYAAYRVCQINQLIADWDALKRESAEALRSYPKSKYSSDFSLFFILALTKTRNYNQAKVLFNKVKLFNPGDPSANEGLQLMK